MRPNWDEYFFQVTELIAQRSTCLRRKVGAVIVRDKRILATGYNGAPRNLEHCGDRECIRNKMNIPSGERLDICRALHAEQNAILQAAHFGVSIDGSDIYISFQPCFTCAKMLINAGIKTIYIAGDYPDEMAALMLNEAGVKVRWNYDKNKEGKNV